jgi:hypothetical protein
MSVVQVIKDKKKSKEYISGFRSVLVIYVYLFHTEGHFVYSFLLCNLSFHVNIDLGVGIFCKFTHFYHHCIEEAFHQPQPY